MILCHCYPMLHGPCNSAFATYVLCLLKPSMIFAMKKRGELLRNSRMHNWRCFRQYKSLIKMLIFAFISIAIASEYCVWVEIEKCPQRINPREICSMRANESKEKLPEFVKSSINKWSLVHYHNGHSFHRSVSSLYELVTLICQ